MKCNLRCERCRGVDEFGGNMYDPGRFVLLAITNMNGNRWNSTAGWVGLCFCKAITGCGGKQKVL